MFGVFAVRKLTDGRKAEVFCSKKNHYTFYYTHSTNLLTINFHYKVVNRCGVEL